jgi:hypothetical protein
MKITEKRKLPRDLLADMKAFVETEPAAQITAIGRLAKQF